MPVLFSASRRLRRPLLAVALLLACGRPALAADTGSNWATDAELEGIVDLLDPDYQQQPIKVERLPLKYAVKTVYGSGRRLVYTFEDPNCSYCRQLHHNLAELGDLTVHTFVLSFLGDDSRRLADAVWCAKDRAAAWRRVMQRQDIGAARKGCTAPHAAVKKLTGLLGINLTPTIFYANGTRINGLRPRAEIEAGLATATNATDRP